MLIHLRSSFSHHLYIVMYSYRLGTIRTPWDIPGSARFGSGKVRFLRIVEKARGFSGAVKTTMARVILNGAISINKNKYRRNTNSDIGSVWRE